MIMEVGKCACLQNRGVFCLYWSSFSPFRSIYKPFGFIGSSFLRDIFDLGPVPYSIFRSVPWNVIKPRKCEKRNIGQEYGRCNGSECTGGRVEECKERHDDHDDSNDLDDLDHDHRICKQVVFCSGSECTGGENKSIEKKLK